MRLKIESFSNKHLIKLNKAAIKDKAKLADLITFLLMMDEHVPEVDFFQNAGLDLFPTLFKLTFYNEDNSVINSGQGEGYLNSVKIFPNAVVRERLTATALKPEAQVNFLVNNLLAKMIEHADK
jgi:hypothetical protein